MGEPPTGTITFLFTDIEGSTHLLQELGERYEDIEVQHAAILRQAIAEGVGPRSGRRETRSSPRSLVRRARSPPP
jgi:class 3 adenylate cyclase